MRYEYTDTFCGETNYSWVIRGELNTSDFSLKTALRKAREEIGLKGCKGDIILNTGDFLSWKPRGMCTLLMIWKDLG